MLTKIFTIAFLVAVTVVSIAMLLSALGISTGLKIADVTSPIFWAKIGVNMPSSASFEKVTYIPGSVVVVFKEEVANSQVEELLRSYGLKADSLLNIPESSDITLELKSNPLLTSGEKKKIYQKLQKADFIDDVMPDYTLDASAGLNFSSQLGIFKVSHNLSNVSDLERLLSENIPEAIILPESFIQGAAPPAGMEFSDGVWKYQGGEQVIALQQASYLKPNEAYVVSQKRSGFIDMLKDMASNDSNSEILRVYFRTVDPAIKSEKISIGMQINPSVSDNTVAVLSQECSFINTVSQEKDMMSNIVSVSVQPGPEDYWVSELKKCPLVDTVSKNYQVEASQ